MTDPHDHAPDAFDARLADTEVHVEAVIADALQAAA